MKHGVLIDKDMLIRWIYEAAGTELEHKMRQAIELAPEAVIPIDTAGDCSECMCSMWFVNGASNYGFKCRATADARFIAKDISDESAPEWCPQITKL